MSTVECNGYTYSINEQSGTTVASGQLQNAKAARDPGLQVKAGGSVRASTDQGGHLVAAQHNGPAIKENLYAQDGKLNQGAFKTVENAEHRLISDPAETASIKTERTAFISNQVNGKDARPDAFMVSDQVTYSDGSTQRVHLSFANISPAEQSAMNKDLESSVDMGGTPNPVDELRGQMTTDEYSQLMTETDKDLSTISQEFEQQTVMENAEWSYDVSMDEAAAIQTDSDWGMETENDTDVNVECSSIGDIDSGMDSSLDGE